MSGNAVISLPNRQRTVEFKPSGHEVPLASAIKHRTLMRFVMMDGTEYVGEVSQFDKWTVTIYPIDGNGPITLFKHSLSMFCRHA